MQVLRRARTAAGRLPTDASNTSPSECAGSIDSNSTRPRRGGPSQTHRGRRRHSGLADAALPAEQQERGAAKRGQLLWRDRLSIFRQTHRRLGGRQTHPGQRRDVSARRRMTLAKLPADSRQRGDAARLPDSARTTCRAAPRSGGPPCDRHGALRPAAAIADRARRAIGQHPVDDHVGDADAGAAKRPKAVFAFGDRQRLRQKHPAESRASGSEQRAGLPRLPGQERNQAIGRVRASDPRELLANQTVLALKPLEHARRPRRRRPGRRAGAACVRSAPYRRRPGGNRRPAPAGRSRSLRR